MRQAAWTATAVAWGTAIGMIGGNAIGHQIAQARQPGLQPDGYDHPVSNTCNAARTKQRFEWVDASGRTHVQHFDFCVIPKR